MKSMNAVLSTSKRKIMNHKFIDVVFAFLVFSLPFQYVPQVLWQNFLGGPFGQSLVVYPLLIGFIYTAYCQWKYKNVIYKWDIFKKFIFAYLAVLLVSLAWGLFNYPYYDQILNGPAAQIERLPKVLAILHGIGLPIAEETLLKFWMFARPVKAVFFETFYTFGAAYMIFCWYHDRAQRAIDILLKVTTVDLVIVASYGLVDVCYQNGQMWAQNAIIILNSIIHANVTIQPCPGEPVTMMFRDVQNRSLFLEPSYFGIFMAFAYPVLWLKIFQAQSFIKKLALLALFGIITFELFLSQSRLAIAVNFGVFLLFAGSCLYKMQKELITFLMSMCIVGAAAFCGSMAFLQYGQVSTGLGDWYPLATKWNEESQMSQLEKGIKNFSVGGYFHEGLGSLSDDYETGQHAGSNHSRFTIQRTHIDIGLEHPLLGVGTSLRQGYLRDKLDKDPGDEIQIWNKTIDKKGLLSGGFPDLGEFTLHFAETGALGFTLYISPAFILLCLFAKVLLRRKTEAPKVAPVLFIALSFIGMMVTGLGEGINITFCYWLDMAIGYLILHKEEKTKQV